MAPIRKASISAAAPTKQARERRNPLAENRLLKRWLAESCLLADVSHEALARAVGRNKSTITKWLDPDYPEKVPPAWVLLVLPASVALHFDARLRGYRDAKSITRPCPHSLGDCVLQNSVDSGAVAASYLNATRDGVITQGELMEIEGKLDAAEVHNRELRLVIDRALDGSIPQGAA